MSSCVVEMKPVNDSSLLDANASVLAEEKSSGDNKLENTITKGIYLSDCLVEIHHCLAELDLYILSCEEDHMSRILSNLYNLKKFIFVLNSPEKLYCILKNVTGMYHLTSFLATNVPLNQASIQFLLSGLVDREPKPISADEKLCGPLLFLGLLVSFSLLRTQKEHPTNETNRKACLFTFFLSKFMLAVNRREFDVLSAKLLYLNALAYERAGLMEPLLKYFEQSC